jgi:opacity protein-like surface antigen
MPNPRSRMSSTIQIGCCYALSAGWDVTAEYRYFRTEDATLGLEGLPGDAEYEYRDHSVVLGVRYSFQ